MCHAITHRMLLLDAHKNREERVVYISITHRIDDPNEFTIRGQRMTEQTPTGLRPLQFLPDLSFTCAVCLWEGPSLEAVRDFVDGTLGASARNEYFAIHEDAALGLPTPQGV